MLKSIRHNLTNGWDAGRITRLALGLFITGMAAYRAETLLIVMGVWMILLPLLNVSCCGTCGCDINHASEDRRSGEEDVKVTNFEEINSKL